VTDDETRRAAARNLAEWHHVSVRALGLRPRRTDAWWTCAIPAPNIYHSAVALRPAVDDADRDIIMRELRGHLDDPDSHYVSICDSWDELPLDVVGRQRRSRGPWCIRPPGAVEVRPLADADALGVEVVRDRDTLVEFERTVVEGFGARMPIAPFDIHAPQILDDPSMHLFLGRAKRELAGVPAGHPVAVAMAYLTPELNGVYGVATVPLARGRGFATRITVAALEVAYDRPAMLQPSPEAQPIYRRLGFTDLGTFSHWT